MPQLLRRALGALANAIFVYMALLVLAAMVTFAADALGAAPFHLAIGPVRFYEFVREEQGFRGSLLVPASWLALAIGIGASYLRASRSGAGRLG